MRDPKNRLTSNKFAHKKTKEDCKLENKFQKKAVSQTQILKKTAYNEGWQYYNLDLETYREFPLPKSGSWPTTVVLLHF